MYIYICVYNIEFLKVTCTYFFLSWKISNIYIKSAYSSICYIPVTDFILKILQIYKNQ